MSKLTLTLICGLTLAVSACGPDAGTRAVTGAGTGLAVAGPVGAAAGGVLGATGAVQVR